MGRRFLIDSSCCQFSIQDHEDCCHVKAVVLQDQRVVLRLFHVVPCLFALFIDLDTHHSVCVSVAPSLNKRTRCRLGASAPVNPSTLKRIRVNPPGGPGPRLRVSVFSDPGLWVERDASNACRTTHARSASSTWAMGRANWRSMTSFWSDGPRSWIWSVEGHVGHEFLSTEFDLLFLGGFGGAAGC